MNFRITNRDGALAMTIDDLAKLGKECLVEHATEMKVRGVRPFDYSAAKIAEHVECHLPRMQPEDFRPIVDKVLEHLAHIGPFQMSEPEFSKAMSGEELRNVEYQELRLSFKYGLSASDGASHLWISCWYFPG